MNDKIKINYSQESILTTLVRLGEIEMKNETDQVPFIHAVQIPSDIPKEVDYRNVVTLVYTEFLSDDTDRFDKFDGDLVKRGYDVVMDEKTLLGYTKAEALEGRI